MKLTLFDKSAGKEIELYNLMHIRNYSDYIVTETKQGVRKIYAKKDFKISEIFEV